MKTHIRDQAPGSREARSSGKQARRRAREDLGQTTIEFIIAAPVLLTILIGVMKFGIAFNNYEALTFGANAGAQALSISAGPTGDPCKTASTAVEQAAPLLKTSSLSFSYVLNGTSITGSTSCSSDQGDLVASEPATITVTYPCDLKILGVNFVPGCTLTAQSTMLVQ
jgi:Flp pilus assembly protein TadG